MVQNNKVLTVSYGTFSCTLEGFDDSFETMKAIAEYFRDLAADDRYFGSEPPQPDAEMLTRIAQRDASKHVEASQSDSGLLLRASQQAAAPTTAAVPTAAQPEPTHLSNTPPAQGSSSFFADAEPVENAPPPAADSIAAKLQRIRAVVSHSEENSVVYAEDEETNLVNQPAAPMDAVAAAFEAGSLDSSDLTDTAEAKIEDAVEAVTEATTSAVAAEDTDDTITSPEPEAKAEEDDTVEESIEPAQPVAMGLDTEYEDQEETPSPSVLFTDLEESTDTDEPGNILGEEAEDVQTDEVTETRDGYLTAEDETNVLSEISKVEATMENLAPQSSPDETALDQDMSRLMDKADVQMDDPATNKQRETYSHLRSAVAATEAERAGQGKADDETNESGYRGDLTSVVSPRRPEIQVTSMRPQSDTSSPLKLVAEQRIDTNEQDAGPVTPRRVTAKTEEEEETSEEGGFAQFAQEQGAQSLPDLLEAAAAYLSFIEGQEQFSRPQLMNKIRSLKQDDFNREESLRSFGQLLRDGKIEKAGGGRFAASTQIGFRPDDERAVG
ncbi:hypothetical protein [Ruegeria sp. Ofav3-42]|uniref:hypothetical protein n=1 Tax=Ruegeria sp. Ofav3-42 TaxID=2917759 RepID=UPI001EF4367C|nr:hypothetical protein [Ruegeria sp. Ofav3-42]MCG7519708.1 hypothetical protein [Ruegeria sp. Ofav3-42]